LRTDGKQSGVFGVHYQHGLPDSVAMALDLPVSTPVIVDGIEVMIWPARVSEANQEEVALDCLFQAWETYKSKAQFVRFDEGAIDRLRRIAYAVVAAANASVPEFTPVDALKLADRFCKLNGHP
jgi:hypothetical protein